MNTKFDELLEFPCKFPVQCSAWLIPPARHWWKCCNMPRHLQPDRPAELQGNITRYGDGHRHSRNTSKPCTPPLARSGAGLRPVLPLAPPPGLIISAGDTRRPTQAPVSEERCHRKRPPSHNRQPANCSSDSWAVAPYQPVWDAMKAFTDNRTPTPRRVLGGGARSRSTQGQAGKAEHLLAPAISRWCRAIAAVR